jgi:hypothetical protein
MQTAKTVLCRNAQAEWGIALTLEAEYDAEPGAAHIPDREPTLTMRAPGPVERRRGRNARVVSNKPNTFTSKLNRLSSDFYKCEAFIFSIRLFFFDVKKKGAVSGCGCE